MARLSCHQLRDSQRQYIPDRRLVPVHLGHILHPVGLPVRRPVPAVQLHKAFVKLHKTCFKGLPVLI